MAGDEAHTTLVALVMNSKSLPSEKYLQEEGGGGGEGERGGGGGGMNGAIHNLFQLSFWSFILKL